MAPDGKFTVSEEFVGLKRLRASAAVSWGATNWQAVSTACEKALRLYPGAPVLGLWRAQAGSKVEGFAGLAKGVDLLTTLCRQWDPTDDAVYAWLREKVAELVLSVPLTEDGEYTYTTVLNAQIDPERAAAAAHALRTSGELRNAHRAGLEALGAALERLAATVNDHTYGDSYVELTTLPGRIAKYLANEVEAADRIDEDDREPNASVPLVPGEPREATDVFLQIEGFPGESVSLFHRGWIEALSYRHTMQPPSPAIVIEKLLDAASPKLYQACSISRTFPSVTFDLCRAPGDSMPVLRVELTDAVISSITQQVAAGSHPPIEQITFRYRSVRWTYTQFGSNRIREGVVATTSRAAE